MKRSLAGLAAFLIAAGAGVGAHQVILGGGNLPFSGSARQASAETARPPMEVISKAADRLASLANADADSETADQVAELLKEIGVAAARVEQGQGAKEADRSLARITQLIAHYVAFTIDRSRFAKPFHELAQQLILSNPESTEACQAEILQLLVKHDLSQPPERSFLEDVEKFAAGHKPNQAVTLYCLASQELVSQDQPEAAKALLQHGIKAYQSVPSVISKLVNQSADLELSKPATPQFTRAQYDAMIRAYEGRVNAAGSTSGSCSPRRT